MEIRKIVWWIIKWGIFGGGKIIIKVLYSKVNCRWIKELSGIKIIIILKNIDINIKFFDGEFFFVLKVKGKIKKENR